MTSLRYRLFGIPDNLEEFIDKLHKKEITKATVKSKYEHYDGSYLCGDPRSERIAPQTYECITIEADKYRFKLEDEEHSITYSRPERRGYQLIVLRLQRASLHVAKQLEQNGLSTTLNSSMVWETPNKLTTEEAEKIYLKNKERYQP